MALVQIVAMLLPFFNDIVGLLGALPFPNSHLGCQ